MKFIEGLVDGDHILLPIYGNAAYKEKTTIVLTSNLDSATVTIGYKNGAGAFVAYEDGEMTTSDFVVNHGAGAQLMVRVAGVTSNPVVLGYSV